MDSSSLAAHPPPWTTSSPRDDKLITAILVLVALVDYVVAALCSRVRQTWHNNKGRRRLTKRAAWLHDLLQLLPPPSAAPASSTEEEKVTKGGDSAASRRAVRTVLARRIEATVSKVDRVVASMSSCCCCCLLGFARSNALARRLERANKDVDEVYTHLLPVVAQIDAACGVEQVLVGVMQKQEQGGGEHDGNLQAANKNNHSDAQRPARPNGSNEIDWEPLPSENNDDQASKGTAAAFEIRVDR